MGFLSRVGIGSVTVDTILETDRVQPGDSIDAHVEIEGGSDEQQVDDLEIGVAPGGGHRREREVSVTR